MQILTVIHWTEIENPCGRVRGRIEGPQGDDNFMGRPTVLTNLDLWKLPKTKSLTIKKEHTQSGWRAPGTYVAEGALSSLSGRQRV